MDENNLARAIASLKTLLSSCLATIAQTTSACRLILPAKSRGPIVCPASLTPARRMAGSRIQITSKVFTRRLSIGLAGGNSF